MLVPKADIFGGKRKSPIAQICHLLVCHLQPTATQSHAVTSFSDTYLPNWRGTGPRPHHRPTHLHTAARVCTAARVLCPISLRTPPGLCSRPTNSPRPAHGGSWGRLLCVHARGVCFWLLAFLCSPARLSLCPFVPYASGAAILIPCPALGTPRYPYRNATYARVRACLRPYVLTPATGVHFFGSTAMPSDAPPAHPRAEKRPQVSAQPPAPGTRLRPLRLPRSSRPSRRAARGALRSLPGAGSAPASVRAAPPAAACCRSHLRGRAAPPEPRAPRGYIAPRGRERRVPRSALRPGPRDDRGALSSCGRNGGESRRSRRSRSRRSRRRRSRRRRGRGAERRRRAEGGGRKAGRKL